MTLTRPRISLALGSAESVAAQAYAVIVSAGRGSSARPSGTVTMVENRLEVVGARLSVRDDRSHLVAMTYREVLRTCDESGVTHVAIPSTLAAGAWPLDDLTRIGIGVLRSTPTRVNLVTIACPTPAALERWAEALAAR